MKTTLFTPDLLKLADANGETYIGGSQDWYEDRWHKMSGCGPVAASNLVWYMTRPKGGKEQYLLLMREMYTYFVPGMRGINTSTLFSEGIMRYLTKNELRAVPQVLDIPLRQRKRPDIDIVRDFVLSALHLDAAVALLCLSNGTVRNLENWHWVTIITLDADTMQAEICDYGKVLEIDISEWLNTSNLGGALVYLKSH